MDTTEVGQAGLVSSVVGLGTAAFAGIYGAVSKRECIRVIDVAVHGGHEDLHILGYGLDHTDATLLATLEDFRADRIRRIHAMADNLREEQAAWRAANHQD